MLSVRSVGSCRAMRPASPIRKMTGPAAAVRATAAGSEQASFQTRSCTGPLKDDLLAKIEIGNRRCHRLTSCGSPHFRYDVVAGRLLISIQQRKRLLTADGSRNIAFRASNQFRRGKRRAAAEGHNVPFRLCAPIPPKER